MGVHVGRAAVRGPARVADAEPVDRQRPRRQLRVEVGDLAGLLAPRQPPAVDDGDAGRVVAAVLQAAQPLDHDAQRRPGDRRSRRCRTWPEGTGRVTVGPRMPVSAAASLGAGRRLSRTRFQARSTHHVTSQCAGPLRRAQPRRLGRAPRVDTSSLDLYGPGEPRGLTTRPRCGTSARSTSRSARCSPATSASPASCTARRTRSSVWPPGRTPFVVGVAGSVAVGKSTTARLLRDCSPPGPGTRGWRW